LFAPQEYQNILCFGKSKNYLPKLCLAPFFPQCRWGGLYYKFRSLFSQSLYNKNRNPTNTGALVHRYIIIETCQNDSSLPHRLVVLPASLCPFAGPAWRQHGNGGSGKFGNGSGRLAAVWQAERRQRSSGSSLPSAWQWRWKRSGGGGGGSSTVAVVSVQWLRHRQAAWQWWLQRGVGGGSAVAALAEWQRQRGSGMATAGSVAAVLAVQGRWRQHSSIGGNGGTTQRQLAAGRQGGGGGSGGSASAATKTPVTTAMVGAQTTINKQLKAAAATATAMATMTATTMKMKMKATAAAAVAAVWQQCGSSGGGSAATARRQQPTLCDEEPAGQMPISCCNWTCDRKRQRKQ
jgi:hypothetical protein